MKDLDFLHRKPHALGKRVHRLGLATTDGIDEAGMRAALDAGLNCLFYKRSNLVPVIREAIRRDRERYVIAAGPVVGYFAFTMRHAAGKALRTLGTDHLDFFHLF
jgi:hypothetical protein